MPGTSDDRAANSRTNQPLGNDESKLIDLNATEASAPQERPSDDDLNDPITQLQKRLPFAFVPILRPLTVSDLGSVVALENAAFPHEAHRATPEKLEYRLTTAPELSFGIFQTVCRDEYPDFDLETLQEAKPVETGRDHNDVSVLLAHVVSTKSKSDVVTDSDMDYPKDWKTRRSEPSNVGHQSDGRTVCVHSLAVSPKLQKCGLGTLIMKAYLQQMKKSGAADRVSLICQDYLANYYEQFGYENKGSSKATFGGGGWYDMTLDLANLPTD